MYTKILSKNNHLEKLKRLAIEREMIKRHYFTNKLNCLDICYNACSRQEFFTALSVDLVDLVNIGQANFILAQKFVSFILCQHGG